MLNQLFPNAGVIVACFLGLISVYLSGYANATNKRNFVNMKDCSKKHEDQARDRKDDEVKRDKQVSELHEKINDIAKIVARIDERTKLLIDKKGV